VALLLALRLAAAPTCSAFVLGGVDMLGGLSPRAGDAGDARWLEGLSPRAGDAGDARWSGDWGVNVRPSSRKGIRGAAGGGEGTTLLPLPAVAMPVSSCRAPAAATACRRPSVRNMWRTLETALVILGCSAASWRHAGALHMAQPLCCTSDFSTQVLHEQQAYCAGSVQKAGKRHKRTCKMCDHKVMNVGHGQATWNCKHLDDTLTRKKRRKNDHSSSRLAGIKLCTHHIGHLHTSYKF